MAGWQAVAAGKMIEAEEKLLEAVRRHRKHRWIGTWGSARLDLAIFYLQTKRPQQAMAAWQETAAEMKRLDMPGQPLITGRKVIPLLELAIKENVYPQTAQRALDAFGINAAPRAISIPDSSQSLTPRETETLQLLMTGASNREIAEQLVITQRTVKAHVSNILSKLQVTTRTEAVARAHELSLLQ
ncbi:MAG: response regulator transcription factor [bacterium]|nr:response regulator transcription factor [bacterium]